jgi:hypothetical protein
MNVLHSPLATVHVDRYPLLSPAIWIGECWKNGTSTDRGWTQPKLKAFLAFLDTVGVQSIALWCMAEMGCPHIKSGNLSKGRSIAPGCTRRFGRGATDRRQTQQRERASGLR